MSVPRFGSKLGACLDSSSECPKVCVSQQLSASPQFRVTARRVHRVVYEPRRHSGTTGMLDDAQQRRTSRFLARCVSLLPSRATAEDSNRLAAAFFAIAALDRLALSPKPAILQPGSTENEQAIAWILRLQCEEGGFRGSTSAGEKERPHLVISLFAVLLLGVLRATKAHFAQINVAGLLSLIRRLQQPDGRCNGA